MRKKLDTRFPAVRFNLRPCHRFKFLCADPCTYARARMHDILMCVPVSFMWLFEFLMARFLTVSIFFLRKKGLPIILLGRCAPRSRYAWICFDKLFYSSLGTYIRIFRGLLG